MYSAIAVIKITTLRMAIVFSPFDSLGITMVAFRPFQSRIFNNHNLKRTIKRNEGALRPNNGRSAPFGAFLEIWRCEDARHSDYTSDYTKQNAGFQICMILHMRCLVEQGKWKCGQGTVSIIPMGRRNKGEAFGSWMYQSCHCLPFDSSAVLTRHDGSR